MIKELSYWKHIGHIGNPELHVSKKQKKKKTPYCCLHGFNPPFLTSWWTQSNAHQRLLMLHVWSVCIVCTLPDWETDAASHKGYPGLMTHRTSTGSIPANPHPDLTPPCTHNRRWQQQLSIMGNFESWKPVIQMSHQENEEPPERSRHGVVKCLSGEFDALDRVCQVYEDHELWKDAQGQREREGERWDVRNSCNTHKWLGHREKWKKEKE